MENRETAPHAGGEARRRSTATGVGSRIGAVGWTLTLFTALAFGGGLFLAFFSFPTPERPNGAVARAPEFVYLPPSVFPVITESKAEAFGAAQPGIGLAIAAPVIGFYGAAPRQARETSPWFFEFATNGFPRQPTTPQEARANFSFASNSLLGAPVAATLPADPASQPPLIAPTLPADTANQPLPVAATLPADPASQPPSIAPTLPADTANQPPPIAPTLPADTASQPPPIAPTLPADMANQPGENFPLIGRVPESGDAVPEPGSVLLICAGAAVFAWCRWREGRPPKARSTPSPNSRRTPPQV